MGRTDTFYIIYIFKTIVKILTLNQVISVYHALFESIITYDIIGWGGVYDNNKIIIKCTKKATKIMYNKCRNNQAAKEKVDKLLSIQGLYYYKNY